ncbi:hypothetical protein N9J52_01650 [Flavobacteriales bacterium]|nr:hypothetical protein [Flavobacteriales bacterium]
MIRMVTFLLLLVFGAKLYYVILTINRGFDFTDEGIYQLWLSFPEKDPNPFYYFHRILLGIFPWIEWNIISLRLLKIVVDVVIGVVIGSLLNRLLPSETRSKTSWGFLVAVCLLGVYSTTYSLTFYNGDITFLCSALVISACVLALVRKPVRICSPLSFASGFLSSFQFFNKFSSAVLLVLLVICVMLYVRAKRKVYLEFLMGLLAGCMAFFILIGYSPKAWYQEYLDGIEYIIRFDKEPVWTILQDYARALLRLSWYAVVPLFVLVPLNLIRLTNSLAKTLVFLTVLGGRSAYLYLDGCWGYCEAGYSNCPEIMTFWFFPLISVLIFSLLENNALVKELSHKRMLGLLLVFLIPLVAVVGTGSVITIGLSAYLIPIYGVVGFVMVLGRTNLLLIVTLMTLSVFGFSYFQSWYPFRQIAPQSKQTFPVQGPNEVVFLDSSTATFVQSLQHILMENHIEVPYPIVAFYDLPGLVYLCGGYSPATPWYFRAVFFDGKTLNQKDRLHDFNRTNVSRISSQESKRPVFVIEERDQGFVHEYLTAAGISLTKNYGEPIRMHSPLIEMEQQVVGSQRSTDLLIYVPVQSESGD